MRLALSKLDFKFYSDKGNEVLNVGQGYLVIAHVCNFVEYVKDNYNAWFHNPSYHRYRETHSGILLDMSY